MCEGTTFRRLVAKIWLASLVLNWKKCVRRSSLAHLRSHSGGGSGEVFCGCPTAPEFQIQPSLFRTLILERLRLPLQVTEAHCECGARLDRCGRHRAACGRSGRLRSRATATEKTLARVCREAGATVRCNAKLREMNITVPASDEREIEVFASGLLLNHGGQFAVDITLRCALNSFGEATPNAATVNGATLLRARRDKETKYWELLHESRCQLIVVGIETGGRWSDEALRFVEQMANARSRGAAPALRRSAFLAWRRRWSRMISISCGRAFASSLVSSPAESLQGIDGAIPDFADLFGEM